MISRFFFFEKTPRAKKIRRKNDVKDGVGTP